VRKLVTDLHELSVGDIVTHDHHDGVGFRIIGEQTETRVDEWWEVDDEGEPIKVGEVYDAPTGLLVCVMVGDDYRWYFDPADLIPLDGEHYCHCGQTGCAWNTYD
jgi:hypothetical protein